jgi:hypothetical protein
MNRAKTIIKQTPFSLMMAFIAASELVFTSTFGGTLSYDVVIALALMTTGILFSFAFQFFKVDFRPETGVRLEKLGLFTMLILFIFIGTSILVPQISSAALGLITVQTFYASITFNLSQPNGLTAAAIFIIVLIPNSEEQFFRGAWGNFFLVLFRKFPYFAPIPAGAVFAIFHFAVYGLNYQTLGILFVDGATMVAINAFATGVIDSSIVAHMLNNALSFGVAAGILQSYIPGVPPAAIIVLRFAVPLTLGGIMFIRAFRQGNLKLPGFLT